MSDAFKRTWPDPYIEPGTPAFPRPAPPPPPLVPCRDATAADGAPDEAVRAATRAEGGGWPVRVTYAQGGEWIIGGDKGKCICGAVVRLYVDTGFMFKHSPPTSAEKVACTGGYRTAEGLCSRCQQRTTLLKKGGMGKHYLKPATVLCEHVEAPHENLGKEKFEPDASIAVRVEGLGFGLWVKHLGEWGFDLAYLRDRDAWRKVAADEFQAACASTSPA